MWTARSSRGQKAREATNEHAERVAINVRPDGSGAFRVQPGRVKRPLLEVQGRYAPQKVWLPWMVFVESSATSRLCHKISQNGI
jgi:hypothetical protein